MTEMSSSPAPVRHKFQSFWHGGPLSPYECVCLRSFLDHGHDFELYTYDPALSVPTGVRLRDAAEFIAESEVFTYQEGFGKGSPSAFSNLFRYKLLIERGGWWVDTDVVCLTKQIPHVTEFFAYQDTTLVNSAIIYFGRNHPIMLQCWDEAAKLGRTVEWGQTGPRLLTRVLKERHYIDRALPPEICYPIHYDRAADLLRPGAADTLASQIGPALFLHLWNALLTSNGQQKTLLPPKGSLLRQLAEKHPANGWAGEYPETASETAPER
jgi:hypothetical protein